MFKNVLNKLSRPTWLTIGWVAGLGAAVIVVAIATAAIVVSAQLPELDEITHYQPRQPLEIVTRDGMELAQFGPERRRFLAVGDFPDVLKNALISTEDVDFRTHNGISLKGITRAFVSNLLHRRVQGGSTITQQVARTFFLSRKQSYSRKFSEVLLAFKIERALSKDQILELYMNQIYLGQHAYGFEAASLTYFGKPSARLTAAEAAMLAGLPQNPRGADPVEHFERARARQLVVLMRMHETGAITDAQYEQAKAQPLKIVGHWTPPVSAEYLAEMVRQAVVQRYGEAAYSQGLKVTTSLIAADQQAAHDAVRRGVIDFDRRQPWRGPEDNEDLPPDDTDIDAAAAAALHDHPDDEDLRVAIVTHASPKAVEAILASGETLHLSGDALRGMQAGLRADAADDLAITRGAIIRVMRTTPDSGASGAANGTTNGTTNGSNAPGAPAKSVGWRIAQWPDAESALVALDPGTGQVRALVGGFDFSHNQFNHVTSAWRQPGSSFKPFVYSTALEHGVQPATLINDAPLNFGNPDASGSAGGDGQWNPQNDDNQFDGPISLRTALAKSKNLVSIRLVQMLGVNTVRDWASHFGFAPDKHPDNLTIALGAGSVTPMLMARAYSTFANGGFTVTPRFIEKITDAQGKVLFQAPALPDTPGEDQRAIPARNAFVIDSLLNEVTRVGTGARAQAQLKRSDIYGKTGTTNDAVDTWFAGFQPKITTVVWMGRDNNTSMGAREFGATLALPIWIDFMRRALKSQPVATLQPPAGVQELRGDWMYDEYVDGGYVAELGMAAGNPPSVTLAPRPDDAASGAASGAVDGTTGGASMSTTSPGAVALPPMSTINIPGANDSRSLPITDLRTEPADAQARRQATPRGPR